MKRRLTRYFLLPAAVVLTIVSISLLAGSPSEKPAELTKIEQLKDAFNSDAGKTRLILLLSPT